MAMPDPFSGSASSWASDRHPHPEQRGARRRCRRGPVAIVVGMGHQGHAGGQQLGPGGLDVDRTVAAGPGEAQPVVGAGPFAVFELGLGHGGPEVDVPQGRGGAWRRPGPGGQGAGSRAGRPVGPARRWWRRCATSRPTGRAVRHRSLEDLLVLGGQPVAEGHEVAVARPRPACFGGLVRRDEVGVEGQARVAADPEVVLHPPLGGQAVVVPAHRVEDGLAPHAPEAGHGVGVGVGEDVADVEGARHGGWRGVDGVDLRAAATRSKA